MHPEISSCKLLLFLFLNLHATQNKLQNENVCGVDSRFQYDKQANQLPFCPEDLTYHEELKICYKKSVKSQFPPQCPFENVLPFESYKTISINEPIWAPVKMNVSGNKIIAPMQWIEKSTSYKNLFEHIYDKEPNEKYMNLDCIVYYENLFKGVSCEDEYAGICAYNKFYEEPDDPCNELDINGICRRSDFSYKSKCFCLNENIDNADFNVVEFLKPYQNFVFDSLTSDTCAIALRRNVSANKCFWINSQTEVDYTYWSNSITTNNENNVFGVVTPSGWLLVSQEPKCVLYESEITYPEVELELKLEDSGVMTLTVKNSGSLKSTTSLVFCFTNAAKLSWLYRFTVGNDLIVKETTSSTSSTYQFTPYTSTGPGHYWCEAVALPDLRIVTSNTIFFDPFKGSEFVAILKSNYTKGINPLYCTNVDFMINLISIAVGDDNYLKASVPRLFNILDLDEDNLSFSINIHISFKNQITALTVNDQIQKIKESMSIISDIVSLDQVYNTEFCASEISEFGGTALTWPTTRIGYTATSKELCFVNSARFKRLCDGDFINGARWSVITESCEIPPSSDVTDDLVDLLPGGDDEVDDLLNILNRNSKFNPIDIYLIAEILSEITDLDVETLRNVVDNLLEIDRGVLKDAEESFLALDEIFEILDDVTGKCSDEVVPADRMKNFEIVVSVTNPISCIYLEKTESGEIFVKTSNDDLETVTKRKNVDSAVVISPQLQEEIQANSNAAIVITIFNTDALFTGKSPDYIGTIFGIRVKDFENSFKGAVQVVQKPTSIDNLKIACSSWNSSTALGSWHEEQKVIDMSSFLLCNYYQNNNYFTLSGTASDDPCENKTETPSCDIEVIVKDTLDDLLNGNKTASEITEGLLNISSKYEVFDEDDIFTVSQIIGRVSDDPNLDLDAFAEIISNLNEVDRDTLSNSQQFKLATDRILHNVDKIFKNHNFSMHIEKFKKNFMIVISDVKASNFSGVLLKSSNDNLEATTLFGHVDLNEMQKTENLQSAIVLSDELKSQLLNEYSKVILTVYPKDALFNEAQNSSKYVSKIFGLILSNLTTPYLGAISILHKITKKGTNDCSFWNYNPDANVSGTWTKDIQAEHLTSLLHCKFWHTTHFALLIIDSDKYGDQAEYLDLITTINCALSLFGLFGIALTAILYKRWRVNTGNQLLMNFVLAIALQIATFYASSTIKENFDIDDVIFCTIIGVALHYSLISQFCWMFIIAILQFKRFVEVFTAPPKYVLLKASLCGWVLPLLPVACVFFLDRQNYINGKSGLCYPSGLGLYLGVWLPITIIVVINLVIFIYIIYSVAHRKTECADTVNNDVLFQWRLAVLLFFMLGLTWSFAFLSELDFGVVFVYLFCFTATLQGFVMFLFFIVFNQNTRYLYCQSIKNLCCRNY